MIRKSLFNQSGSIRYGIALLLVILVIIIIFYYLDRTDTETEEFGYTRESERFETTEDDNFFEEDEAPQTGRARQSMRLDLKPVDESDLEEPQDPSQLGKNPGNAFYHPPSPEERRKAENKSDSPPPLRP
ncbi:MAG: hypothetical protein PHI68_02615 [Candidatus Cloacimonetes bacterium]|nr:hypothetical protein [Candidatus Cloacimonadota bacterium]